LQPQQDGCQDDAASVDECVFVVSGRQAAPVLEVVEGALNNVAVLVVVGVEVDGSPAA
jgi:hypothetical protein